MALWKDPSMADPADDTGEAARVTAPEGASRSPERPVAIATALASAAPARRAAAAGPPKESLIASDVTIEGKIEGSGDVRIAGRFKGDVNVQGDVTVEQGAHVNGQVNAANVFVSGEVEGNINAVERVDLNDTGAINGDVKAAVITVAAGSRMRGQAEFGWGEQGSGRK